MAGRKAQITTVIKVILLVSFVLIAHYYPIMFIKFVVFAVLSLWLLAMAL